MIHTLNHPKKIGWNVIAIEGDDSSYDADELEGSSVSLKLSEVEALEQLRLARERGWREVGR